ncbi:phosphotransferase family protein [Nocardia sp. IFM 10818]
MVEVPAVDADGELRELIRPQRLGPVLAQRLGDPAWRDFTATLIAGGKSNLTFELDCAAGQVILRRPPSGVLLPRAHDMEREVWVQTSLSDSRVPVPPVLTFERTPDLIGAPFYVMVKVPGQVIRGELPPGYAPLVEDRRRLAEALIDVLAELHQVDPARTGLADFGRPTGFLERQLRRWRQQWEHAKTVDVPDLTALGRELADRMPADSGSCLVHGDFRLDNCLMSPTDPGRVRAVLDWELSTLGAPLSDLGLLLFYWREPGEPQRLLSPTVTELPGFPTRAQLVDRYAERTGRDVGDIAYYQAFAHLKFAIIAQGVAARAAAGAMGGQDFGDLGPEVVRIAREGRALLAAAR